MIFLFVLCIFLECNFLHPCFKLMSYQRCHVEISQVEISFCVFLSNISLFCSIRVLAGDESSCDGHWCPKNDMTDLKGLIYFEGQCIPQDKVCDFEHDCPLGMDEMDCEYDSYDYDSEDGDYSL